MSSHELVKRDFDMQNGGTYEMQVNAIGTITADKFMYIAVPLPFNVARNFEVIALCQNAGQNPVRLDASIYDNKVQVYFWNNSVYFNKALKIMAAVQTT